MHKLWCVRSLVNHVLYNEFKPVALVKNLLAVMYLVLVRTHGVPGHIGILLLQLVGCDSVAYS
jgi:hypothetical protein